jgi:hypothetical protein
MIVSGKERKHATKATKYGFISINARVEQQGRIYSNYNVSYIKENPKKGSHNFVLCQN